MPHLIQCPGCKSKLKASEKHYGKTLACPKCKAKIRVPAPGKSDGPKKAAPPSADPAAKRTDQTPKSDAGVTAGDSAPTGSTPDDFFGASLPDFPASQDASDLSSSPFVDLSTDGGDHNDSGAGIPAGSTEPSFGSTVVDAGSGGGSGDLDLANLDLPLGADAPAAPAPQFQQPVSPVAPNQAAKEEKSGASTSITSNKLVVGLVAAAVALVLLVGVALMFWGPGGDKENVIAEVQSESPASADSASADSVSEDQPETVSADTGPATPDPQGDETEVAAPSEAAPTTPAVEEMPEGQGDEPAQQAGEKPTASEEPRPAQPDVRQRPQGPTPAFQQPNLAIEDVPDGDQFILGQEPLGAKKDASNGPGIVIEMPSLSGYVAFSPSTGELAILQAQGVYILKEAFFRGDTNAYLGPVKLPEFKGTKYLQFKRYKGIVYLLVSAPNKIWVLDARTLQLATTGVARFFDMRHSRANHVSNVDPKSLTLMATNDETDPLVYTTFGRSSGRYTTINLETGKVNFSHEASLNPLNVRRTFDYSVIRDPYGRIDNKITLTPEPDDEVQIRRKGEVTPLQFPPDRYWFVARDHYKLYFIDRMERSSVKQLPLPPALASSNPDSSNTPFTKTFYDGARNRLVFFASTSRDHLKSKGAKTNTYSFWVLPIDQAKLSDRIALSIDPKFPRDPETLEPGVPYSISLGVKDPRVKVSLMNGPEGAVVEGDQLKWTPTLDDVGIVNFQFKMTDASGARADIHESSCRVSIPPYPLRFIAHDARISPDGKHAAMWINQIEDEGDPDRYRRGRIAIVQTTDRRVLVDDWIPMRLKDVALGSEFAVLVGLDGYSIEVRRLSDWSLVARHNLTAAVTDAEIIAGKLLLSVQPSPTQSTGAVYAHLLDLPNLDQGPGAQFIGQSFKMDSVRQTDSSWRIGGSLLDGALEKPLSIPSLASTGIKQLNRSRVQPKVEYYGSGSKTPSDSPPSYFKPPREPNRTPPNSVSIGEAIVKVIETEENRSRERIVKLNSASGPFGEQSVKVASYRWSGGGARIMHAADTVLLVANRHLYSFKASDIGIDATESSEAQFSARTESLISSLSTRRPTPIKLEISGGTPPYKAEATLVFRKRDHGVIKVNGVSILVDGKKLDELVFTSEGTYSPQRELFSQSSSLDQTTSHVDELNSYAKEVNTKLAPFMNPPPRGFPLCFIIDIKVSDAEGKQIEFAHPVVLDHSGKEWMTLAKNADARRQQIEVSRAQAQSNQPLNDRQRMQAMIGDYPFAKKIPLRKPELPFVWNVATPQELSNQIRQHWPPKNLETREFKADGLAAYALLTNSEWKGQVEANLEWEHRDGTKHKSVLSGLSRGTLSFKSGTGPREVSLRLISNDSAVKVFEIFRPKLKGLSVQERVDAKETESFRRINMADNALGMGVEGFQRDFGCLPPRAIVDQNGKPLLSWRVTSSFLIWAMKTCFHFFIWMSHGTASTTPS